MFNTISTSVKDITENEVMHMASAVLWNLGRKQFFETDFDREFPKPALIECTYINIPKESLYMKGSYFIEDLLEHQKIKQKKISATQLMQIFSSDIVYFNSLYVCQKPVSDEKPKIYYWNGKELGFHEIGSEFNRGPWIKDLKEIYNTLVKSYPIL